MFCGDAISRWIVLVAAQVKRQISLGRCCSCYFCDERCSIIVTALGKHPLKSQLWECCHDLHCWVDKNEENDHQRRENEINAYTRQETGKTHGKQHLAQNSSVDQLSIILNNLLIANVYSHKILGIEVDQDLDLTNHCKILARKISKRIGLLKHISPYLKRNQNLLFSMLLIYGHQPQKET